MDAYNYQKLAERTECDQEVSRRRYSGIHGTNTPVMLPVRLNHAVLGLTGEVGELAGAVEKWLHYGRELDTVNVAEELGDCLWYIALACNALGVDMGKIMEGNIQKLKTRYPDKYSDARAWEENRDRLKERQTVEQVVQDGRGFGHFVQTDVAVAAPQASMAVEDQKKALEAELANCMCDIDHGGICRSCVEAKGKLAKLKKMGERTKADVLAERKNAVGGGCCERFANNQACDCLEKAPCPVCNFRTAEYPNLHGQCPDCGRKF